MAIEKNIVIGADLSGLEAKLQELINLLKQSQKQANKTADSIDDIADSVEDVGDNAKEAKKGIDSMSAGFKTLGLSIKAAGIGLVIEGFRVFKDVLSSNQGVSDAFAVALQTLIFAFNGVIQAIENRSWSQFASALTDSMAQAKEFVELQKIAMIADAERNKLQLESQILAERQRQLRDNERKSIADRIEAN
jgi:t-SNARE complex subunit (syntaxin)